MSYFNTFFAKDYWAADYWGPSEEVAGVVSELYGCLYTGLYANMYIKPTW